MFGWCSRRQPADWVGLWVLFPWFPEKGERHVAPEDRQRMEQLRPYCKLFHCRAWAGPYVELDWDGLIFRVTPRLLKRVPEPTHGFGTVVTLADDPSRSGKIREIYWHFKKRREFYKIEERRRLKSRRYWSDELVAVAAPDTGPPSS